MFKSNIVFATLAMLLFATAQMKGCNLFDVNAAYTSPPSGAGSAARAAGTGPRTYHK